MKRILLTFLSALMLLSVPVFATENGSNSSSVTINLDNIEELMIKSSLEMQKVKNDLETARGNYFDIADDMEDIQDKIKATDNFTVGATLTQQYDSLKDTRDNLKCMMDMAEVQYEQKVKKQVLKAKMQYLYYFIDEFQAGYNKTELDKKQNDLDNAKLKLEKGYISKNQYDSLATTFLELKNKLSISNSKKDANIRDLKILMGIPQDSAIKLENPSLSNTDFKTLISLDFDKDLKEMLSNSAEIKAKEISVSSKLKGDYAKSWEIDAAKIALQQAKDALTENFRKQYDNLINSLEMVNNSRDRLEEKNRDYENEQEKYQKGYSSNNKVTEIKIQLENVKNDTKSKEIHLYYDYLSYLQAIKGF